MEYKIYLFKRFGIIYYAVRDDDNIFARKDDNILFNLGINACEFSSFIHKNFNGLFTVYDLKFESWSYDFETIQEAKNYCNFINLYTQSLIDKKLNSFEDNKVFFQEFYDSYKVIEKLCGSNEVE